MTQARKLKYHQTSASEVRQNISYQQKKIAQELNTRVAEHLVSRLLRKFTIWSGPTNYYFKI